jgi:hypothetical protein
MAIIGNMVEKLEWILGKIVTLYAFSVFDSNIATGVIYCHAGRLVLDNQARRSISPMLV